MLLFMLFRCAALFALAVALVACSDDSPTGGASTSVVTTAAPPATTQPPASSNSTAPTGVGSSGDDLVELVTGGVSRRYRLFVPAGDGPFPLVLDFHALGSSAAEQDELSGMRSLADQRGFVVVQPEGRGAPQLWDSTPTEARDGRAGADLVFALDLVEAVASQHPVDRARVYAVGMSNGGGMANRLACDAADVFAAVAAVAAAHPLSGLCDPAQPVGVLGVHGTEDPVVPYDGAGIALPSLEAWTEGWVDRNGCQEAPDAIMLADDVEWLRWTSCEAGVEVGLVSVEGGGHGWPGTTLVEKQADSTDSVSASEVIWEFFARHVR